MPEPTLPIAVQWFAALGPVITGAGVAYVAWQQWKTARNKLRFDLFEKRLAVYHATRNIYFIILTHSSATHAQIGEFHNSVRGAEFLFDEDVKQFYQAIGDMASRLSRIAVRNSQSLRDGFAEEDQLAEEEKLFEFILAHGNLIERKFKKHLDLSGV